MKKAAISRHQSLVAYLVPCLFGVISLLLATTGKAQNWTPVPLNFPYGISGLCFPTPDTGYFVSTHGQIGRTYNGGMKWEMLTIQDKGILEDVYFRNTKLGYVCGRNGLVFFTTNGGRTWTKRSVPDSTAMLLSVYMCSENDIVVTGSIRTKQAPAGVCYYSSDGGVRWKKADVKGMQFGEITRTDSKSLSFLSWGMRHLSTDCGKSWQSLTTGDGRAGRIAHFAGKNGFMIGNEGWGAFSQDGGVTWDSVKMNTTAHLTCMVSTSPKKIFVGGMDGTMLVTEDGGASWKKEELPFKFDVVDMERAGGYLIAAGSKGAMIRRKLGK